MQKPISTLALVSALTLSSASSGLAEGPETHMSRDQIKSAMLLSTQSSGPASASASAQGSLPPTAIVLGLLVVLTIAVTRGTGMMYSPT